MNAQEIVLDADDIQRIITRITHQILENHKGAADLTLIGIHTRGVFLAQRIQQLVKASEGIEIPCGDLDITFYRDDWTRIGHQPVVQATDIFFDVDGKQIVLVDDVLYTGRTTRCALDALMDFGRPSRIELAVLVDRGHRELPIRANYVGKYLETKRSQTVNVLLSEHDQLDRVVIEHHNQ